MELNPLIYIDIKDQGPKDKNAKYSLYIHHFLDTCTNLYKIKNDFCFMREDIRKVRSMLLKANYLLLVKTAKIFFFFSLSITELKDYIYNGIKKNENIDIKKK